MVKWIDVQSILAEATIGNGKVLGRRSMPNVGLRHTSDQSVKYGESNHVAGPVA